MSVRGVVAGALTVLFVACGGSGPLGPETVTVSFGRVAIQAAECVESCPPGVLCPPPLPCLAKYTLSTTLSISELAGQRVLLSDIRITALAPDGSPIGASYPHPPAAVYGGETKVIDVLLLTTPGRLLAGTMLHATVASDRGEATAEVPVPAI